MGARGHNKKGEPRVRERGGSTREDAACSVAPRHRRVRGEARGASGPRLRAARPYLSTPQGRDAAAQVHGRGHEVLGARRGPVVREHAGRARHREQGGRQPPRSPAR